MFGNEYLDERLQENIWESKIPIKVEISSKDLMTTAKQISLYFLIPRVGYLCNIFGDIMKAFESSISAQISDIWLEYKDIPIKWQYPFGVIVDALDIDLNKGPVLLNVHVREFPEKKVIPYESINSLIFQFQNSIKAANQIKFPKTQKILSLDPESTKRLKNIPFIEDSNKMLTELRQVLIPINGDGSESSNGNGLGFEKYPVRLVFEQSDMILTKAISVDTKDIFTMKQFFVETFGKKTYKTLLENCTIKIHGLEVEEEMGFLFYYYNFSYLDNFLYISFCKKDKSKRN